MSRHWRALPASIAVAGLVLAGAFAGAGGPAVAAGGAVGSPITLRSGVTLAGYDAATAKDGTTYVGWIGDDASNPSLRQLHLCVLKLTSRSCVGGVQTASALGSSSAQDLKVVITGGQVELVWIAQTGADSGEFSGVFGTNTVTGGSLGTSVSVAGAPTLGSLTSAIAGRHGGVSLAAVGESGTLDRRAYYYPTVSATPTTFKRPYFVGNAQLADNGKQTVVTTTEYGSLSGKVAVASKPSDGTKWTGFKNVSGSYTRGNVERLVTAGRHIRLVGVNAKAIYDEATWSWNGKSFGTPKPSGDRNDLSTIDANTDGSGRLVSVDTEVDGLMVSNFGNGNRASRFLVKVKDTFAGGPAQISTSAGGRGFVIWGIEKIGVTGQILKAQAIRLPALTRTVHQKGRAGTVSLTGPTTCLPMTTVHVGVKGKPAHGWKVTGSTLRLGSKNQGGSLNGSALSPHHSYTLKGTVAFAQGGAHASISATLKFKTCSRP
jgi:hypothetical protein